MLSILEYAHHLPRITQKAPSRTMDSTFDSDTECENHQIKAIKSVKSIAESLIQGHDINLIRNAIADLLGQQLQRGSNTNNHAARPYFMSTLGALTLNLNSKNQSSPVGLYTCLIDLEKAIAILDGKDPKRVHLYKESTDALSYKFLIEALEVIRQHSVFQAKI